MGYTQSTKVIGSENKTEKTGFFVENCTFLSQQTGKPGQKKKPGFVCGSCKMKILFES